MKTLKRTMMVLFLILLLGACTYFAPPAKDIKLITVFSDNMVLQRDLILPVWGTAAPGGMVKVEINQQSKRAKADDNGKWAVTLDKMTAGGPYQLSVIGEDTIVYHNVMVGEVWICSGQSNMEMPLAGSWGKVNNYEEEIAAADYPDIRLFQVKHTTSNLPLDTINCPGWVECSPATLPEFSSVAYFFGREVYKKLQIPVGLIHTSWGGTPAEAWTSAEALKTMPDFAGEVEAVQSALKEKPKTMEEFQAELKAWEDQIRPGDAGFVNGDPVWSDPKLNVSDWKTMTIPTRWENAGYPNLDGIMWFRKEINLPAAMAGKPCDLHLGPINDIDITWFNGVQVGSLSDASQPRDYHIPGSLVKAGKNVIVVNVEDIGYSGGLWGRANQMYIENKKGNKIPLDGDWLCKIGFDTKVLGPKPQSPQDPHRPTVLFNAMLHPLIPYSIRGAIWYQGESNAGKAYQYRTLFPMMIKDWRRRWQENDFYFLFVQLANFKPLQTEPQDDDWAELREAQLLTLSLPNTGMAVTIDIGDADDIHPKNKQEVGRRLALNALHLAYGQDVSYSGPIYKSMTIEGNKIRLTFDHVDGGLQAKNGETLTGFAIAAEDKKFVWADAEIDGQTILVSHAGMEKPVAVRYAWASNPLGNLFNNSGLPASPFRTDNWPGITQK
jgi:sialate O-acetylesterase